MVHQLSQGVGVKLLQELNKLPTVPPHSLFGRPSIKYFYNIPKNQSANRMAIVFSPALAPYAERYALRNPEGWLCAATLTLPSLPPILSVSVYDPPDKCPAIEALLSSILRSHPHFFLGGNFNAVSCPHLELSLTDDLPRHWLRQATTSSPPSLGDTLCIVNPTSLAFTRYKTSHSRSQKRIDLLLASPTLLTHAPLPDCFIDRDNTSTDHHPVSAILDLPSPALPPRPVQTVFRRLNENEKDDLEARIQPWTSWAAQNKQALRSLPLDSLVPILERFFSLKSRVTSIASRPHPPPMFPKLANTSKPCSNSFLPKGPPTFNANTKSFAGIRQKQGPHMKNCV